MRILVATDAWHPQVNGVVRTLTACPSPRAPACLGALDIEPRTCVEFAAKHTWKASARAFVENMTALGAGEAEGAPADFVREHPGLVACASRHLARVSEGAIQGTDDGYDPQATG